MFLHCCDLCRGLSLCVAEGAFSLGVLFDRGESARSARSDNKSGGSKGDAQRGGSSSPHSQPTTVQQRHTVSAKLARQRKGSSPKANLKRSPPQLTPPSNRCVNTAKSDWEIDPVRAR